MMGIHGLWTKEELAKIGKDARLTTEFMNEKTFLADEIRHYPYNLRRTFRVVLASMDPDEEPITVYATSPAMARWFIGENYNGDILHVDEVITKVRPVQATRSTHKTKNRIKATHRTVGVRAMR